MAARDQHLMHPIYHVATADQWHAAQATGALTAASLASEGFIHCSQAHQVLGVLARFFPSVDGLHLLCIDAATLGATLRYEPASGEETLKHELFPHCYAPIALSSVIAVGTCLRDERGHPQWPVHWEPNRVSQEVSRRGKA